MRNKPVDIPTTFPPTPDVASNEVDPVGPPRRDGVTAGPAESMEQNVNHPKRYTKGKIECIDALESAVVGKTPEEAICVANVIKYLWRYEEKEPLRSLKSAEWYLKRLISKYENRCEVSDASRGLTTPMITELTEWCRNHVAIKEEAQ